MQKIIIKSPLSPKNIYNLLFHPSRLFAPNVFIRSKFWTLFVTFPFFIYYILFVGFENFTKSFSTVTFKLITCVIVTLLFGVFLWYIIGWFYNLRIKWSGAIDHDKTEGRITMIYIWFIQMCIDLCTIMYIDFSPSIISSVLYILTSSYFSILNYSAVKSKFTVEGIKPIFWFLITPISLQISCTMLQEVFFNHA